MNHALVEVTWHDAHAVSGAAWMEIEEIEKDDPCVVSSVGWLLADTKRGHVVIAQSHNSEGFFDHIIAIPTPMVVTTRIIS
jgi:hypothetical protein